MRIVIWVRPGTWESCVDAAAGLADATDDLVLLQVDDPALVELAWGAYQGLAGRGGGAELDSRLAREADQAAEDLLTAAEQRLGRSCERQRRTGRLEREVTAAAAQAGLLILARDGDRTRLGPKSLGPPTRFVLDHAPCRVLLVWPDEPPDLTTLPPEPPHPGDPPPPPHGPGHPPPPHR